jgi:hypothetical protein
MKHICPNFLFILVILKCIKILGETFGGPGWKEKLLNIYPNVYVLESQGQSSKGIWYTPTTTYSILEVGRLQYGFHRWSSQHISKTWLYLGNRW